MKILRVLLLIVFAFLLVFTTTAFAENDTADSGAINPLPVEGTDKITVNNWALVEGKYRNQLVMEFTNISDESIPDFEAQIIFYDDSDNIMEIIKDGHDVVLPGTTVVTQRSVNSKDVLEYAKIEVLVDTEAHSNSYVNHVENLEIKGNVNGDKIFLQVVNNDTVELAEIEIVVVFYDENDVIIGATEQETRKLAVGKKEVLEFQGYDEAKTASCKYYVNQAHTFFAPHGDISTVPPEDGYVNSGVIVSSKNESDSSKATKATSNKKENVQNDDGGSDPGYEAIYNEYVKKIQEATPGLIEAFKTEAKKNSNGLEGLAEINTSQLEKLAEIMNEGTEKMASYMMTKGSGKYDEYYSWAEKLYDIYFKEAEKITDVYMSSAMDSFGF